MSKLIFCVQEEKNIDNLLSAEEAQRVVKLNHTAVFLCLCVSSFFRGAIIVIIWYSSLFLYHHENMPI